MMRWTGCIASRHWRRRSILLAFKMINGMDEFTDVAASAELKDLMLGTLRNHLIRMAVQMSSYKHMLRIPMDLLLIVAED